MKNIRRIVIFLALMVFLGVALSLTGCSNFTVRKEEIYRFNDYSLDGKGIYVIPLIY